LRPSWNELASCSPPPADPADWRLPSDPCRRYVADEVGYGAFGIRLRARDMANFGQLFLDEGCWNGQQLVPERWVRDATTRIELARYGRLWWDVDVGLHPAFAAMGSDGQLVLVVPKLRLVGAIQAQANDKYELSTDTLIALVETAMLPNIE
jgi:CubicO group peptidase (beta-lactamase class C family)